MQAKKVATVEDSAELQAYREEVEQSVNQMLAPWTLKLKANHVTKVVVEYSGGGDSGQIDSIACTVTGEKDAVEIDSLPGFQDKNTEGYNQFEQFAYALMDKRGWSYNNEGGQGSIEWDIEKDTFTHHDETNYTEVESHNYNGLDGFEELAAEHLP